VLDLNRGAGFIYDEASTGKASTITSPSYRYFGAAVVAHHRRQTPQPHLGSSCICRFHPYAIQCWILRA
jgi:hypothetical protein